MRPIVSVLAIALATAAALPSPACSQPIAHAAKIANLPAPVVLDAKGNFETVIARVGDDMFVSGQPTEAGLRELKAQGVTTIVNLRTPQEMKNTVNFDEAAVAAQLGMKYVHLPVRGDAQYPYAPATVAKFNEAVSQSKGKVLLHCTVAWRASHLWAAYLIQERGIAVDVALANARAINLMDAHHSPGQGRQPVEDFLNRSLPSLGRQNQ